jgi:Na+-driven multidrug efflux pump
MDVGVSAGVQGSLISFSNLFVWRYINRFSTAAVAGVGIAQRVDKFVSLPTTAFGTATTTFVGQNLGAQNHPRVREGVRDAMILSLSITIVLGILIYPVTGWLASLFNRNPEVIRVASDMCRALIPFYFISAIRQVLMGLLRAHGRSKMNTVLTLAGMVGMRQIFLAVTMSIRSDIVFIYYGYPVGWLFAGLFVGVYYLICRKSIMQLPARRTKAAKAAVLGANEENEQESEQDS